MEKVTTYPRPATSIPWRLATSKKKATFVTSATYTCEIKAAPSTRQLVSIKVAYKRKIFLRKRRRELSIRAGYSLYVQGTCPRRTYNSYVPSQRATNFCRLTYQLIILLFNVIIYPVVDLLLFIQLA